MNKSEINAFFDHVLTLENHWHEGLDYSFPFDPELVAIARSSVLEISEHYHVDRLYASDTDDYYVYLGEEDNQIMVDLIMLETDDWWFQRFDDRGRPMKDHEWDTLEEFLEYLENKQ